MRCESANDAPTISVHAAGIVPQHVTKIPAESNKSIAETYHKISLPSLLRSVDEVQPAQLLAYRDGLLSGLEAGQIRRPLGALLGLHEEIHQLFACQNVFIRETRHWR